MAVMMRRVFALGLGTLALASSASIANAAMIAPPRAAVVRSAVPAASTAVQHRYFGTLLNVAGETLTVQLRDGRLLQVNAAQAFALAQVSAPLFRGKPVVIDGTAGSGGVFNATAVKRGVARANWGPDR